MMTSAFRVWKLVVEKAEMESLVEKIRGGASEAAVLVDPIAHGLIAPMADIAAPPSPQAKLLLAQPRLPTQR